MEDQMIFKIIVIIFLFLDFLHNWWIEDQVKEIAKKYNIKLKEYKQNNVVRKDFEKSINAHQGLLDLYQKEKKKNKKLKKENEELDQKFKYAVPDEIVAENYIHKDKIKEILDGLINYKSPSANTNSVDLFEYMIIGETERATGRFVNLDFIKKVLLNESGYNIQELLEEKNEM